MRYGTTKGLAGILNPALSFSARHRNSQAIFYRAAFALFLLTNALQAITFKAGVAKADITPPPGLAMYGFLDRINDNKLSTGTLDPLCARVLVLEAGDTRLALVTLDLGRTFNEGELAQLRQEGKSAAGISLLIVTASHTHSGPNILDVYAGDRAPAWETVAIKKIVAAVVEACGHLVDARIQSFRRPVGQPSGRQQLGRGSSPAWVESWGWRRPRLGNLEKHRSRRLSSAWPMKRSLGRQQSPPSIFV